MSTEAQEDRRLQAGEHGPMTASTLARLLTWLSPAFPTGGFAYSHGLEWAIEAGDITDRASLVDWIADLLAAGSLWSDAILLRHAWRAAPDPAALAELALFAAACAGSAERLQEILVQGAAFRRAVSVWHAPPAPPLLEDGEPCWPLPVAIGAALRMEGMDQETACAAALTAAAGALVSAAVRLVPLGQTDGLRAIAALEPAVARAARETSGASLDDVGGCCLRADIAALRHETQGTRLFRS